MTAPGIGSISSRAAWLRRPSFIPAGVSTGMLWFILGMNVIMITLFILSANSFVAMLPLALFCLLCLFLVTSLRTTMLVLLFLVALTDAQGVAMPDKSVWFPPFYPLQALLFFNLNKSVPIEGLRFALLEAILLAMALLAFARALLRIRVDSRLRGRGTNALTLFLVLAFGAVVWLEAWGVGVRGGDFRQSLWQFRQLFWLPLLTGLCSLCLRDYRDFLTAVRVATVAACLKIAIMAWFYFTVARPLGFDPACLSSHNDSILFVIVLMALVIRVTHQVSTRNVASLLLVGSWLMFGIVINNRRLAFVNVFVCCALLLFVMRGPAKKFVMRAMVLSLPLIVAYVLIGGKRSSPVFKPAALIMSVITQKDNSSITRDIENFNLIVTLKQGKLLGSGWGHEYIEYVKADDISEAFAQYKYIAHNNVLWLLSIGGYVGFSLLFLPIAIGVFLARRAYFFARTPDERTSAIVAMCIFAVCLMQAWGDLGLQANVCIFSTAMALASSAKLAVATGAFPARPRLFGRKAAAPPVRVSIVSSHLPARV